MNDTPDLPPDLTYESVYRNTPFVLIGVVAVLAAGAVAGWAGLTFLPAGDLLWPAVEIAALSVVAIVALVVTATARHRWIVGPEVLRVREVSRVSWLWPVREFQISLAEIQALRRVESGFDVLIELETASGMRRRIMQGFARDKVGVLLPDKAGLTAFANALRKRIVAAGATQSTFQDGLGFWNRTAGLAFLWVLLIATLGLSALILYGVLFGGHVPQGAAMQGLALVILLPIGVVWALYRSLARRSFVLGLERLREDLRAKS